MLHEREAMAGQIEVAHRNEITAREEHISRLLTDMRLLNERLSQHQLQVCQLKFA